MARSTNRVILTGYLGKDPELRVGQAPVRFSLATSESWRDKASGERREKTDWHQIVIFRPQAAEFAEKYLKKGSHVTVIGRLANRRWTDNKGIERYVTEVLLNGFDGEIVSLESSGTGGYKPATQPSDFGYDNPSQTSDREPGDEHMEQAYGSGLTESAYKEPAPAQPAGRVDPYYKGNTDKPRTTMDEPYIDKKRDFDDDIPF